MINNYTVLTKSFLFSLLDEEKLTVDNCLCDACFRHVDRRANVPSYRKRMVTSVTSNLAATNTAVQSTSKTNSDLNQDAVMEEDNSNSTVAIGDNDSMSADHKCVVSDCRNPAAHSLKRKCIRKSVKRFLLNFNIPSGEQCIWLCQSHYQNVIQCSGCVLCKRRLSKNHMFHIPSV